MGRKSCHDCRNHPIHRNSDVRFRHKQGDSCCPSAPVNHTPAVEKPLRHVLTLATSPVEDNPLRCQSASGLFSHIFGNRVNEREYRSEVQRASCNAGRNVTKMTHTEMVSKKARLQSYLRGVKTPTNDVIKDIAMLAMLNRRVF